MAGQIRKRGKRRDGSTKWEARYWDRNAPGERHQKMFRTKGEAQDWLTQQQNAQLTGTHIAPRLADKTFREVADAWRETHLTLEPKTRLGYEQVLSNHLLPELGRSKISAITTARVQEYVARLHRDGRQPGTIRNIYAVLRNALNTAVRLHLIAVNPCTGVKLPRSPREPMLFLTAEEVNVLADELISPVDREHRPIKVQPHHKQGRVLVLTAAYTGLRIGELLALRRQDIDLLRGRIFVTRALKDIHGRHTADWSDDQRGLLFGPTKNHASRTVTIPKFLRDVLTEHLSSPLPGGSGPQALVFPDQNGGPLCHNNWYRRQFKPAVRRALPARKHGLRFHDLRHTCASLLIAAGAHPKAIQERLGHSSITITMDRYGHLLDSAYEAVSDALEAAYTAAQTKPQTAVTALATVVEDGMS
jgi:integrase